MKIFLQTKAAGGSAERERERKLQVLQNCCLHDCTTHMVHVFFLIHPFGSILTVTLYCDLLITFETVFETDAVTLLQLN